MFHIPIYMFSLLFLNNNYLSIIELFSGIEFFRGEGAGLAPNPQPGGPGCLSSSGFYAMTCPAWVSLPVATLTPA